jgi:hypothetical protein
MRRKELMKTARGRRRLFAGSLMSAGVAIAGLVLTPATAHADGSAKGPLTWCPGQDPASVGSGSYRPNWDWNVCHTYWWVYGRPGNVSNGVWEGELPPPDIPLANLSRPAFNCGLFFCQDPGGPYTVDPRIPAP